MKRPQRIGREGRGGVNKIGRAAFGALLLIAVGARPAGAPPSTVGGSGTAESMRRFSEQIIAAYERRDTTALKKMYARQPGALFFWERKMSYSWPQISDTLDSLVSAVAELKLTTSEFRSGGSGNAGWFAATFHVERVTPAGKRFASDGRWTVVAEKAGGRWLIVHEHTSFPLPEP